MQQAIRLAGFFAAHGVWCVADGEDLIPLYAFEDPAGERKMVRYAGEQVEDAVAEARARLAANPDGAQHAVLVHDGFLTLPSGRTDALILSVRDFAGEGALTLAVPYRNAAHPLGFAVHRPKFLDWRGEQEPDYGQLGEDFFAGVEEHEMGDRVWQAQLDDSI
ncbi:hypothetical protein GLE_5075 [Lysobacter enzymogenes]|uniref:Uncharacterized protein n=1 Tax=Lysobacter enzymogenes TaxID=69 RepID=A0A0S2DPN1_LYSEN|nr:hypothetical protein [Lysobacter enzymogenes]ALN60416.1 hypothetical protein GLE_5075 [Lysobacter enzymogenes]QCW28355.1 hypothetical protein FE772_24600 [Lysobacter enzymogenes]